MKKRFFSILAFASLLSFSVCTQSCSEDDDENTPEQKVQQISSQEAAANIASSMFDYVAAEESGFGELNKTKSEEDLLNIKAQIQKVLATGNSEQQEQVARFVADATGLELTTVGDLFGDTNAGTSGIASIINGLSDEEKQSIITNASQYMKGYEDGKDLAAAYAILINDASTQEEKNAALDVLEKDIKEHYQTSNDNIYKSTYVKATAIATGLGETLVKQILDSEHPKETAMIAFGIELEGGQTAEQGTADAEKATKVLDSLKGKTLGEIINNAETLQQIGTYKEAYRNGTDEYKDSFKQGLLSNGVSPALVDMFDSEEDVNAATVMALLGISL